MYDTNILWGALTVLNKNNQFEIKQINKLSIFSRKILILAKYIAPLNSKKGLNLPEIYLMKSLWKVSLKMLPWSNILENILKILRYVYMNYIYINSGIGQ